MRYIYVIFIFLFTFTTNLSAKYLDATLTNIFSQIKNSFTYYGEVVNVLPDRKEAVIQFKKHAPSKDTEVVVFREIAPIYNKITGKIVGYEEKQTGIVGLRKIKQNTAIGDIIENKGIKIGDKVKYSKKIIFKLTGIANLTNIPTEAYDIKNYLDLAISNFPEFELIKNNNLIKNSSDKYVLNLKIFIKDSEKSDYKRISVKLYSAYTNFTIKLFNGEFKLTSKMVSYLTKQRTQQYSYNSGMAKSTIPVYPLNSMNQQGGSPSYSLPNGYGKISSYPNYPSYKPIATAQNNISNKIKSKPFQLNSAIVTSYREISKFSNVIKSIDFYKNRVIFTDGKSLIYGKIQLNIFRKLSENIYKGPGSIINAQFVDVDNDNKVDIVVNILLKNKINSMVYKIIDKKLSLLPYHFKYILGKYDFNNNGKEEFAAQSFNEENIFGRYLYKVKLSNNKLYKIKTAWIPNGFIIFSSNKADIDGDGKKELIFFTKNHKLMIYKKGENIFTGKENYNISSKNFFDSKPIILYKNKKGKEILLIVRNSDKSALELLYSNDSNQIEFKNYSEKINAKIKGVGLYNNEIICGITKDSNSYLVAFPLVKSGVTP